MICPRMLWEPRRRPWVGSRVRPVVRDGSLLVGSQEHPFLLAGQTDSSFSPNPAAAAAACGDGGSPGITTWEQGLGRVGTSLQQRFASCAVCTSRLCSVGSDVSQAVLGAVPGRRVKRGQPQPAGPGAEGDGGHPAACFLLGYFHARHVSTCRKRCVSAV